METEVLNLGIYSIIPPVLTFVLALVFKDVMLALVLGILSGALLITGGNPLTAICLLADKVAGSLADDWNIRIFLFSSLLGGFIGILTRTGAVKAFGAWAANGLRTRTLALFSTFLFGLAIFIDDYFNALSVGTAMRPVCDRLNIARAKLAYILDATAAPVCIIAPVSSWVVMVMSLIRGSEGFQTLGVSEFELFIRVIPYNFYVFLTLSMVLAIIFFRCDFGPMKQCEERAERGEGLYDEARYGQTSSPLEAMPDTKARPIDMIIPFGLLIVSAVFAFPLSTWSAQIGQTVNGVQIENFQQAISSMSLSDAFCKTDASHALFYAIIFSEIVSVVYLICRRLMSMSQISESFVAGVRSMVPAIVILALAWAIASIIKSSPADGGVGLANYLKELVQMYHVPFFLLPISVFAAACLIAFSTGTSYGCMGIMIPISMPMAMAMSADMGTAMQLQAVCFTLGAACGGAVFGDHASPISDTTILSSAGAGCSCLEHFATQLPYAFLVACCTTVGYLVGSLCGMSVWIGMLTAFVCFGVALWFVWRSKTDPAL